MGRGRINLNNVTYNGVANPPITPAESLDAAMAGLGVPHPVVYRTGGHLLEDLGSRYWAAINEYAARGLLQRFVDVTIPEDCRQDVMNVATDILDNPENAGSWYKMYRIPKKKEEGHRRRGGPPGFREIEAPDPALKQLQRALLFNWWYARNRPQICVQGFVPGRGTLTNATKHVADNVFGKNKTLLKDDIRDFFRSITRSSVMNALLEERGHAVFSGKAVKFPRVFRGMAEGDPLKAFGIEPDLFETCLQKGVDLKNMDNRDKARPLLLACVMMDHVALRLCCIDERLPQGSPCSPALANIFMKTFNGLLQYRLGQLLGNTDNFTSTIYADDIVTTLGPGVDDEAASMVRRIITSQMLSYPDISPNYKKMGVFRHGHPQRVTGITITDKLSISRQERDKVRAELHNAATGVKKLTGEDKLRLKGVRAWMRGVDAEGWDSRCEKLFKEVIGL